MNIEFIKLNLEMPNLSKIFENLFNEYLIKYYLNTHSRLSTKQPIGKM